MGLRFNLFFIFVLAAFLFIQRDRTYVHSTKHSQASPIQVSSNGLARPYYQIGSIRQVTLPAVPLLDRLGRKKIEGFIFNHYNQYKFEITFVDLGYSSNLLFSYFSEGVESYKISQKLGFDLPESMLSGQLNLDFSKKNFNLTVRQYVNLNENETITTFNISLKRKSSVMSANFTHIVNNNQCFTALRAHDVISHKCLGGIGSGKVKLDRIFPGEAPGIIGSDNIDPKYKDQIQFDHGSGKSKVQKSSVYNPSFNLTRVLYDGFRGSGYHWKWNWGFMNGFSKPEYYSLNHSIPIEHGIGINIGNIFGEGEDFAYIDGEMIPFRGLSYTFDENAGVNSNITFTAEYPKLYANFTILQRSNQNDDLGIVKVNLLKFEGNWAGWIQRPDGKKYEFYLIAGILERFNSLF